MTSFNLGPIKVLMRKTIHSTMCQCLIVIFYLSVVQIPPNDHSLFIRERNSREEPVPFQRATGEQRQRSRAQVAEYLKRRLQYINGLASVPPAPGPIPGLFLAPFQSLPVSAFDRRRTPSPVRAPSPDRSQQPQPSAEAEGFAPVKTLDEKGRPTHELWWVRRAFFPPDEGARRIPRIVVKVGDEWQVLVPVAVPVTARSDSGEKIAKRWFNRAWSGVNPGEFLTNYAPTGHQISQVTTDLSFLS